MRQIKLLLLGVLVLLSCTVQANREYQYFIKKADDLVEQGRLKSAAQYYKEAIDVADSQAELVKGLGGVIITFERLGDTDTARDFVVLLLEVEPDNKWGRRKLAEYQGPGSSVKRTGMTAQQAYSKLPFQERKRIQDALIWVSNYNGMVDGEFGQNTLKAIKHWQREFRYEISGILSKSQRQVLLAQAAGIKQGVNWEVFTADSKLYSIGYLDLENTTQQANDSLGVDFKAGNYGLKTLVFPSVSDIETLFEDLRARAREQGWENIYERQKHNWLVITGEINGALAYTKMMYRNGIAVGFILVTSYSADPEQQAVMHSIVTATANSFKVKWRNAEQHMEMAARKSPLSSEAFADNDAISSAIPARLERSLPKPQLGNSSTKKLSAQAVFASAKNAIWTVISANARDVSQGSAVAIHKHYLLTNCHVLQGKASLIMNEHVSEEPFFVTLHAANKDKDRCVLFSKKALADFVPIRPYVDVEVGEKVFTIGTPQSLSLTIAEGLLSSKREVEGERYLQTSAPISQGSSGGGLFDTYGNLLGITTMYLVTGQNLNFAIPVEDYWGD